VFDPLERRQEMKCKSFARSSLGVVLLMAISAVSWAADDGAALYKSKCAGCHGANGEGKAAVKAPALKGTALDADKITDHITKGEPNSKPPHKKGISGVTESQAKAIAEFIKTLK
jgi:mono/diheme cytochrome c family protein